MLFWSILTPCMLIIVNNIRWWGCYLFCRYLILNQTITQFKIVQSNSCCDVSFRTTNRKTLTCWWMNNLRFTAVIGVHPQTEQQPYLSPIAQSISSVCSTKVSQGATLIIQFHGNASNSFGDKKKREVESELKNNFLPLQQSTDLRPLL